MNEIELFDIRMHAVTLPETVDEIYSRLLAGRFTQHVVVNVAKVVNMKKDPILRASIEACDIVNIDGMGVVWAGRLLGHSIPERVAGVDLFEALVGMAADRELPVFFLGGEEKIVEEVARTMNRRHPDLIIAGYHHGYFWSDEAAVVQKISKSGARLLFVAITSPKKENFIDRWRSGLGVNFVMGVGGTFDVVAGKVRRAPAWMQKAGLEWLYRVYQEPRRMWKRYAVTNSFFAKMVMAALAKKLAR